MFSPRPWKNVFQQQRVTLLSPLENFLGLGVAEVRNSVNFVVARSRGSQTGPGSRSFIVNGPSADPKLMNSESISRGLPRSFGSHRAAVRSTDYYCLLGPNRVYKPPVHPVQRVVVANVRADSPTEVELF